MNKKKSIYTEKINQDKSEKQVKKDLLDITIPYFYIDSVIKGTSINGIVLNNLIFGQYIPYFYLNMTQIRKIYDEKTRSDILAYLNKIKDDLSYAFGFPMKHQEIYDTIIAIDRPDLTKIDINALPRGKKLNRLRKIHKNIIEYFMQLLHDLYWVDIKTNKKSSKDLNYYVQSIYPIIKQLIKDLECEVDKEFPSDLIEKQMKIEYKKR